MLNKPSIVEYNNLNFMIFSAPDDKSMPYWIEQFKLYNVTDIIRTCEKTYSEEEILRSNINIHDLKIMDGEFPSKILIRQFLDIIESSIKNKKDNKNPCIAVHCIAGLGRAPVLVTIALIEYGMENQDAIQLVRIKRRHAINSEQLKNLIKYKKIGRKGCQCIVF